MLFIYVFIYRFYDAGTFPRPTSSKSNFRTEEKERERKRESFVPSFLSSRPDSPGCDDLTRIRECAWVLSRIARGRSISRYTPSPCSSRAHASLISFSFSLSLIGCWPDFRPAVKARDGNHFFIPVSSFGLSQRRKEDIQISNEINAQLFFSQDIATLDCFFCRSGKFVHCVNVEKINQARSFQDVLFFFLRLRVVWSFAHAPVLLAFPLLPSSIPVARLNRTKILPDVG